MHYTGAHAQRFQRMIDVSIVIINWNTRDLLQACLDSLLIRSIGNPERDHRCR